MSADRKLRSFRAKLLDNNNSEFTGHFTGMTPSQAGRKAISSLLTKETGTVKFMMKEIKKGENNKVYTYQGTKVKKDNTITVKREGVANPIIYKYDTRIKAIK